MSSKFLLIDDSSELKIGYCSQVKGIDGKIHKDDNSMYHKISLIDFCFCDDFKQWIKKQKEPLSRLVYICIIDKNNIPIGRIPFNIFDEIYYHKVGFPKSFINLELKGALHKVVSESELEIWEKWRVSLPLSKNEWTTYTEVKKHEWLNVVRYNSFEKEECTDKTDGTYYIEGTHITDYPSFFCALGEAINGPGGYFGFDIMSLRDCLNGGFGAKTPFTLIWNNAYISLKRLNIEAWKKEIINRRKENSFLLEEIVFEEKGDEHLFLVLLKILLEYNVNIVLESVS